MKNSNIMGDSLKNIFLVRGERGGGGGGVPKKQHIGRIVYERRGGLDSFQI